MNINTFSMEPSIEELYGVNYISPNMGTIVQSDPKDMYSFTLYHGEHLIDLAAGDCVFMMAIEGVERYAVCKRGPCEVTSKKFAVVVRGYAPPDKKTSLESRTILPYVNGCSTRQIFPPERPGDPTLQLLKIPPFSSEQAHHIHSTVRVVHVLEGEGYSIVGMGNNSVRQRLTPGMSIVLDNMCPHHFETENSALVVVPVHVWSALPSGIENNHPMFNGTFLMNQGG